MKELKNELTARLEAGKMAEALSGLQTAAQQMKLDRMHTEVLGLQYRLSQLNEQQAGGQQDFVTLSREHNAIERAAAELINRLSQHEATAQPKAEGITEDKFKEQVLYLLLATKLIVLTFIYTTWQSGGWTNDDFITVLTIILPVFTTYLSLILKEIISKRHTDSPTDARLVKRSFRVTAYFIFGTYLVVILQVLSMRVQGIINAEDMGQLSRILALTESVLGVYVGQIIYALFKKES